MSHPGYFELRNAWSANFYKVAELVQELESELKTMKEKGLPKPLIDKRDTQIETLIEFYNLTEQMLKVYDENIKDYSFALRSFTEQQDIFTDMAIKQLQYMVKHFKGVNILEGIREQPGIIKKEDGTK